MNQKSNPDNWMETIVAQSGGKINRKGLNDAIKNKDFSALIASLAPEDRKTLAAAMSDKAGLKNFLRSEEAKAMLQKIRGGQKNG